MSLQSVADVPLIISSSNSSSERRINPSWSVAHLKSRLEPITGVPAGSQQLSLRVASQDAVPIAAADEEETRLAAFPLQPYAEITVSFHLLFYCSALRALSLSMSISRPLTSCHISLFRSSFPDPSTYFRCVSGALVSVLLFVLIRCLGRIMRLSAPACIASACPAVPLNTSRPLPPRHGQYHVLARLGDRPRSWKHLLCRLDRRYQHVLGYGASDLDRNPCFCCFFCS